MKALSIAQPHAEAIMRGVKSIQHRAHPTSVRGRIYIYATMRRYARKEAAFMLEMCGLTDVVSAELPRGILVGTVELWDCTGSGGHYQWHFRNPERATEPLKPTKRPHPLWFDPF